MPNAFDQACDLVGAALAPGARQAILDGVAAPGPMGATLAKLRTALRVHTLKAGSTTIRLGECLDDCDQRTRKDGFHALHDWDGKAVRVNADTIPVEVVSFVIDQRGREPANPAVAAILLDYYFMQVLGLLAMRAWDAGDPNANYDRLTALLAALQGPGGSGQQFAADAETLMLIVTAHYEPGEWGYAPLLDRVKAMDRAHRARFALGHAGSMGAHLRFGFEATYGRDLRYMRDDNVVDYPWLCWAIAEVMREYVRLEDEQAPADIRDRAAEAILNGLSPDAAAFVRDRPASLASREDDRAEFCDLFGAHRAALVDAFERMRPSERVYSPLALFYNFSHNVVKGEVVDALMWGEAWTLTLNDLFTGLPKDDPRHQAKHRLATTLMAYARRNPDTIRGKLMPVIVYDAGAARLAYSGALRAVKETFA